MDASTPKDLFLQSVGRCLASEEFLSVFYERFIGASREIKEKFRFTDFKTQNRKLKRSLELSADAIIGDPKALAEITDRAVTHDRHHLNIEPRLYDIWLEILISTASEYDDQWSDTLEETWRKILGHVIQHMIRRY